MLPGFSLIFGLLGLGAATGVNEAQKVRNRKAKEMSFEELNELCRDIFKRNVFNCKDPYFYAPTEVPPGWYEAYLKDRAWLSREFPPEPTDSHPIEWRDYARALKLENDVEAKCKFVEWVARKRGIIYWPPQVRDFIRRGF